MPTGIYKHKPLSEDHKKKLSKNSSKFWLGKKLSKKHKKSLSNAQIARHDKTGRQTREENSWQKNQWNRLKKHPDKIEAGHTYGEWELLKKQYNYICPCCHRSEPFIGQKSLKLTEDHIIPITKGGSDLIENIQPLCFRCNLSKRTKIIKF